jgi:hypothetical protein
MDSQPSLQTAQNGEKIILELNFSITPFNECNFKHLRCIPLQKYRAFDAKNDQNVPFKRHE